MDALSRSVTSNQEGIHKNLEVTVLKHRRSLFAKPISEHSVQAFEQAQRWREQQGERPLIFDACCGVGQSSRLIAEAHPASAVIGVDKSAHRLGKEHEARPDNLLLLRADLNDFYRLARDAQWRLQKHYILYPNPWPKSAHLGRRWHGAPVFPAMLALGGELELRTNWRLYALEFQQALQLHGFESALAPMSVSAPLTPFEAKYDRSGQQIWRLSASL